MTSKFDFCKVECVSFDTKIFKKGSVVYIILKKRNFLAFVDIRLEFSVI